MYNYNNSNRNDNNSESSNKQINETVRWVSKRFFDHQ